MRRVDWLTSALHDVAAIESYVAERADEATADAFLTKLRARCERLATLPGTLGTARPDLAPALRSTPHNAYIIYFRYRDYAIEVVNILDARRDALAHFDPSDPAI